jgi:hypothetical protein
MKALVFVVWGALLNALILATASVGLCYEIKGVEPDSRMLDAYLILKARYGDNVEVIKWQRSKADAITIIANAQSCGRRLRHDCEKIMVSADLPLHREKVVRIELVQSLLSRPTEEELVDGLLNKYGQPLIDRKDAHGQFSSRVIVWCSDSTVLASRVEHAKNWQDYRQLGADFAISEFDVGADGRVDRITLRSESHELYERNRAALAQEYNGFIAARKRDELSF